jgi:hypothetical protein
VELHQLVVEAQDQEGRRPVAYEIGFLFIACELEEEGCGYGADGSP